MDQVTNLESDGRVSSVEYQAVAERTRIQGVWSGPFSCPDHVTAWLSNRQQKVIWWIGKRIENRQLSNGTGVVSFYWHAMDPATRIFSALPKSPYSSLTAREDNWIEASATAQIITCARRHPWGRDRVRQSPPHAAYDAQLRRSTLGDLFRRRRHLRRRWRQGSPPLSDAQQMGLMFLYFYSGPCYRGP
jgi:hypothetical protein